MSFELALTILFAEDTEATNEYINDGELVQSLKITDIQALKEAGAHATVGNGTKMQLIITLTFSSGHYQETDRATFQLFTENRVQ